MPEKLNDDVDAKQTKTGGRDRPAERMARAIGTPGLTWRERTILAMIAYYDGDGGAWPSMARLAADTGTNRQRVAETIKALAGKGWLTVRHGRHANRYIVRYHCTENPDTDIHCPEKADSETRSLSGKNASHCPEKADTNRYRTGIRNSHGIRGFSVL